MIAFGPECMQRTCTDATGHPAAYSLLPPKMLAAEAEGTDASDAAGAVVTDDVGHL